MTYSLDDLATVHLDKGAHNTPESGHCFLEVVSMFAKEPFTDSPQCVSPVLRTYGVNLNDWWPDDKRQLLKPFIPLVVGTAGDGQDEARSYLALDWLIRTYTPVWLDLAGLTVEAQDLRDLRRIVDMVAAEAAGPVVRNAQTKAAAAWAAAGDAAGDAAWAAAWTAAGDAAWAAAWTAAGDAAWTAARDAAGAAARDAAGAAARAAAGAAAWAAAWTAAGDAARAAAGDAARAAARAALQPTVEILQTSALDLFHSMINPGATS